MSFIWADTVTAGTSIKTTHIPELRTNTDHVRAHIGFPSGWVWSPVPASGQFFESIALFTEIKNMMDEAYDNNHHTSHFTTHQSSYYSTNWTNHNSNCLCNSS